MSETDFNTRTASLTRLDRLQFAVLALALSLIHFFALEKIVEPQLPTWFADLVQPVFSLPGILYRPIFVCLSLLLALTLYRIFCLCRTVKQWLVIGVRLLVQIALGILCCYLIFVLKNFAIGLVFSIQFISAGLEAGRVAHSLDRVSGYLIIPHIVWAVYLTLIVAFLLFMNLASISQ